MCCWKGFEWSTLPARWLASAASVPERGSHCCSGATIRIRCSCNSRRHNPRCWKSLAGSQYPNEGERVVAGQRLMQASSDIFLGWLHVERGIDDQPRDFYGRQLKDWKGSFEAEGARPEGAAIYGRLCGWTLARAHARSGDRIAIAAYLGGGDVFDRAIAEFSEAYADQNERDYAALTQAVKDGRIKATTGL